MFLEDLETLARRPHSVLISAHERINLEGLLDKIWEILDLVRVYTKKVRFNIFNSLILIRKEKIQIFLILLF